MSSPDPTLDDALTDATGRRPRVPAPCRDRVEDRSTAVLLNARGENTGRYWATCMRCGIVRDQDGDPWHDTRTDAELFAHAHTTLSA